MPVLEVKEMEDKTAVLELLTKNIWLIDKLMKVKSKPLLCQRLVEVHLSLLPNNALSLDHILKIKICL